MESTLINQERRNFVKKFLKTTGSEEVKEVDSTEASYPESVLRGAALKKRRRIADSNYRSTSHVSHTTNIVERAISQAKLIMTDRHDSLFPEKLHVLMILKHNCKTVSLSGLLKRAFRRCWTPTTLETPSKSPTANKRKITIATTEPTC